MRGEEKFGRGWAGRRREMGRGWVGRAQEATDRRTGVFGLEGSKGGGRGIGWERGQNAGDGRVEVCILGCGQERVDMNVGLREGTCE